MFLIVNVWENQIFDVFSQKTKLVIHNFLWNFAASIHFYYNFFSILMKQTSNIKKQVDISHQGYFRLLNEIYICAFG